MGLISFIMDLYENTRKTDTNVKSSKPKERKYDFDAGITGSKRMDCRPKPISSKKNISKEQKDNEGEER